MNQGRSLPERFWASKDWPLWKHLVVAGCLLLAIGVLLTPLARRNQETSKGTDSPRVLAANASTSSLTTDSTTASNSTLSPNAFSTAPPTTGVSASTLVEGATALAILQSIPIEREHRGGYNRNLFPVWSDLDGDGCDTREEVLTRESLSAPQTDHGCTVIAGDWYSVYDGATTTEPSEFDIDHVVALKEAWDSGAWSWSPERRIAFANDLTDPRTLAAVSAVANQSKGDADPSNWVPPAGDRCEYVANWVAIKARWSLSMDESEFGRIKNLLQGECLGTEVLPWPPAP